MEAVSSRLSFPGRRLASSRSALPPAVRIIATAVLVAVAYHLGARFGEQLRFLLAALVLMVGLRFAWQLIAPPGDVYSIGAAIGGA